MPSENKLSELLREHPVLDSDATPIYRIPYPSDYFRGFQGGCSDGKRYYYQVLMHYELSDRTKDRASIARVDLVTKETVYSDTLDLGHANDVAYHPGKHLLIVAENKPDPHKVHFVDPDTLTVVGETRLDLPIYAIDYDAKHDRYLVGLSGRHEFCFLDADLKPATALCRTVGSDDRCVKQGICTDGELLYFILWDGRHKDEPDFMNRIAIYDRSGAHRGVIHFDVGKNEPESVSIVGGEILAVVVYEHSPMIYRITPKIPE